MPSNEHANENAPLSASGWVRWWQEERGVQSINWRANMEYFIRQSERFWQYRPDDVLLDIGCGPGYLPALLKDRVREIHCLDTSQRYVDFCKNRFADNPNVFAHKLDPADYTNLACVSGVRFTKTICNSVVQYYRNVEEIEALLQSIGAVSAPEAECLITDVPVDANTLLDTLAYLRQARQEHYFGEAVKLIARGILSGGYGRAYADMKLLVVDPARLPRLAEGIARRSRVIAHPLTLNTRRKHLLVKF